MKTAKMATSKGSQKLSAPIPLQAPANDASRANIAAHAVTTNHAFTFMSRGFGYCLVIVLLIGVLEEWKEFTTA